MSSATVVVEVEREAQNALLADLFEPLNIDPPFEKELPGGGQLIFPGFTVQKSAHPANQALDFILAFSGNVAGGVVANWLSSKFKQHSIAKLRMITRTFDHRGMEVLNVMEVETSSEELTKIIEKINSENLKSDQSF